MKHRNKAAKSGSSSNVWLGEFTCATCGKPIGEQGVIHKTRACGKSTSQLIPPSGIFCSMECHRVAHPINPPNVLAHTQEGRERGPDNTKK